jgi:hypothetical protein
LTALGVTYPRCMLNGANPYKAAAKGSELERWAAVALRSVHLVGVVWVGAFVVAGQAVERAPGLLMLLSGLVMLAMDLRAGRIALGEVAGAFVLVKLALVGWLALDPRQAAWVFWLLVISSSVASHAPKGFRHWPTKKPSHGADLHAP